MTAGWGGEGGQEQGARLGSVLRTEAGFGVGGEWARERPK